jgi:hypothetical protein
MASTQSSGMNRRQFLAGTTAAAACLAAPRIITAAKTEKRAVIGSGEHRYEVIHDWPQLPDKYTWQTTHNVSVDKAGNLYVIHEGREQLKDHPSIFVFDAKGKFIRAFGQQFQGGGHGLEVRQEGKDEFLYVCAYQQVKAFAKLDLKGNVVWLKHAPMESGVYARGEDTHPKRVWGRNRFLPTNIAFLKDGGFLLADGYGSYYIHRYDKDGNWKSKFGGPGGGKGRFNLPHGLWVDHRPGREERIVVCDRANNTLQYFTMDYKYLETLPGYGLPANADVWKGLMVVPELKARVTILDEKNRVVARLGDDVKRINAKGGGGIRNNPKLWRDGRFVHPHDACFGANGDIYVAEWVATGRISRMRRVS